MTLGVEQKNHRMLWVGRDLWRSSSPLAENRDIFNQMRLLRASSNLALNVSRGGASPTSLGNPKVKEDLPLGQAALVIEKSYLGVERKTQGDICKD